MRKSFLNQRIIKFEWRRRPKQRHLMVLSVNNSFVSFEFSIFCMCINLHVWPLCFYIFLTDLALGNEGYKTLYWEYGAAGQVSGISLSTTMKDFCFLFLNTSGEGLNLLNGGLYLCHSKRYGRYISINGELLLWWIHNLLKLGNCSLKTNESVSFVLFLLILSVFNRALTDVGQIRLGKVGSIGCYIISSGGSWLFQFIWNRFFLSDVSVANTYPNF